MVSRNDDAPATPEIVGVDVGGTGADLSATSGIVMQTSAGAAMTAAMVVPQSMGTLYAKRFGISDKGSVTQQTSITTTVAIENSAGSITTVSSTLAAGASASFTVTNSTYSAPSLAIVAVVGYTGNGLPFAFADRSSNGSFRVTVVNLHATDALNSTIGIRYVIIQVPLTALP